MPGNVYSIYVTITEPSLDQYQIEVSPAELILPNADRDVTLAFVLVDNTTRGGKVHWQFPSKTPSESNATDEYYGITIRGDDGSVFKNVKRHDSGLLVTMTDTNGSRTDYTYDVKAVYGNRSVGKDPTIKNQGGN
jgi:hypothetical protein